MLTKKRIVVIALAGLCGGAFAAKPPQPDRQIVYKQTPQGELKLHVYYPEGHQPAEPVPAIVLFFGGAWVSGSPAHFANQAAHFASRGIVAVCPEYRTEKGHGTTPQECVKDAKSAMRWVRAHAAELGIDPNRIAAGGGSAGGHLAAATALVDGFNEEGEDASVDCRPKALVLFNPVFDNGPGEYGYDRVQGYWEAFSPANNIDQDAPPAIVFFGTKDKLVPVATAQRFQQRMEKAGVRCDLHLYEGKKHGFFNKGADDRSYDDTLLKADQFLVSLGLLSAASAL